MPIFNRLLLQAEHKESFFALRAELDAAWTAHFLAEPHSPLYHYTDSDGLVGILSNKTLWASDVSCMNDSSELTYSLQKTKDRLSKEASQSSIVREFLESLGFGKKLPKMPYRFYAACFCEQGDLLSQWRAYANRGGGYAIGFDPANLCATTQADFHLRKIVYDPETQDHLITDLLNRTRELLKKHAEGKNEVEKANLVFDVGHFFHDCLVEFCLSFKHPGFSEEHEWRVVKIQHNDEPKHQVEFRTAQGFPVPYVKFDIRFAGDSAPNSGPITMIRYGPTRHPDTAKESLQLLVERYELPSVQICGSEVPLRF
jgi:hypothetical protein